MTNKEAPKAPETTQAPEKNTVEVPLMYLSNTLVFLSRVPTQGMPEAQALVETAQVLQGIVEKAQGENSKDD
jgi:hypothetical protein